MNARQRRINKIAQALIEEHVLENQEDGDDDFESVKGYSSSSSSPDNESYADKDIVDD